MKVLLGCEHSGTVRDEFIQLRPEWEVFSCDLLHNDHQNHITGDVFEVLNQDKWDLLIAHPPCQYLSVSGMHWTTRGLRDPKLTDDAVEFFRKMWTSQVPYICLENPVSVISSRICKPSQIVQPYQFGDDASKKTCLWLQNLPKLQPTEYFPPGRIINGKPRWSNQLDSGHNNLPPSKDRWKIRSTTYPGIAKAMATQWIDFLEKNQQLSLL